MPGTFRHPPQPWQRPRDVLVPPVTIFPTHLPSPRQLYAPNVQGNQQVSPSSVPTRRALYAPFVNLAQTVSISNTPTRRALYAPTVTNTQAIQPAPITGRRALYAPAIEGSPQFINMGKTILSQRQLYLPQILGGSPSLQIYIAGVNVTPSVGVPNSGFAPAGTGTNATATQITSQAIGRATATFDLVDVGQNFIGPSGVYLTAQAMIGLTVRIVEQGATLFAGCMDTIAVDREMPFASGVPIITYHCTALDKSSICDHRIVQGAMYPSGMDVAAVIQNIVATFLNGEGITLQGVPPVGGVLGLLTANVTFNYDTVTDAFNQLATISGSVWWIDPYGVLYFSVEANLPLAPWDVTESAPIYNIPGTPMVTDSLSGGSATSGYRNKQYVVSNLNTVPGSGTSGPGGPTGTTETYTFANGQPGIISIYILGVLTPVAFTVNLPIGSVLSITVDGFPQTFYELSNYSGQTPSGPNDYLWVWTAGNTGVNNTVSGVPGGATIVIEYIPGSANGTSSSGAVVGTAISPISPMGAKLGTCGSGIFEEAEQVQNVSTIEDLNALAQAYLNQSGNIPQILQFGTNKPGLAVGQQLSVLLPTLGIYGTTTSVPVNMIITQITGTASTGPLDFGSWFQWQVTAVNNFDPQNWITYLSRLIQRTQNPLPVLQVETASFVLGAGASLAGGNSLTNPYVVKRTGLVSELLAASSSPPVGQNLVLTINRNGQFIAQIVMPAGTLPNQLVTYTVPSSNQLYLFKNDILSVNASYQPVGGGPYTNASSVTLNIVWSM